MEVDYFINIGFDYIMIIIALLLTFAVPSSANVANCNSVKKKFELMAKRTYSWGENANLIPLRLSKDGTYVEAIEISERIHQDRITVHTTPVRIKVNSLASRAEILKAATNGRSKMHRLINKWMDFVIEVYGRRSWSPQFKDKLRKDAREYAARSHWSVSYEKKTLKNGKIIKGDILATIKQIESNHARFLIQTGGTERSPSLREVSCLHGSCAPQDIYLESKDGKIHGLENFPPELLPMEVFLKKVLPRSVTTTFKGDGKDTIVIEGREYKILRFGTGTIFEPGSLATRETLSESTKREIAIELLASFVKNLSFRYSSAELENSTFYTYVDAASLLLYKKMGLAKSVGEKIKMDGVNWRIISFSFRDFVAAIKKRANLKDGDIDILVRNAQRQVEMRENE